ncbi:hypothetical protein [Streptomyces sp. SID13726]|uniref:hypothetical protein n=1 Tax=Streptomyces sp. SID13726 TaxID=2706058 RepID=UPI00194286E7|nr:hypothetical protein [Streptomyces sp. SID13726]
MLHPGAEDVPQGVEVLVAREEQWAPFLGGELTGVGQAHDDRGQEGEQHGVGDGAALADASAGLRAGAWKNRAAGSVIAR